MKTKSNLLNAAKNADYVFISVMGPHAQEKEDEIFRRKTGDLKECGESFWVSGVNERFIAECREKLNCKTGYLILVNGNASDTESNTPATKYSEDKTIWKDIDANLTPVTGKLPNKAYFFDDIEILKTQDTIDLDYYEDTISLGAIKFGCGNSYSNVFAKKNDSQMPGGMKNHERKIVAVLRLKYPYVVWVK
jgi:hypothetical protein